MRRILIAGNWKMHNDVNQSISLAKELKSSLLDITEVDILVCPTYTALKSIADICKDSNILVGAQNMYFEDQGAFTGEISAQMISSTGASHVLLGHSERRHVFGETNEEIAKKLHKAIEKGLIPVLCIGELLQERENGKMKEVLVEQLSTTLKNIKNPLKVILAYEPVWAIGTGLTASPQQAQDAHKFIRNWIVKTFDKNIAEKMTILYGGSVKPNNIADLISCEDVDGALVGGASLKSDSFSQLIENSK